MDWIEISVRADGEVAEAVSELFNRLNGRPDGQGGAVTEVIGFDPVGDDHHPFVTVKTYLPADEPDTAGRQRQIEEGLWFLGRIHPLSAPQARRLVEEDWANAWKASYHRLRIGKRFWVIPAWLVGEGSEDLIGTLRIILDPGMAFGTGLHPSTQLCLAAMEDVVRPGMRVLDAGCGSGILSIAAARLGASTVDAFDIDPIAVRATHENAGLNNLPVAIHAVTSAGPAEGSLWQAADGFRPTWDVILVNILPHIIIGLLESGLHTYLAPGGRMILAGIVEAREPEVRAALAERSLAVERRSVEDDWVALVARRESTADKHLTQGSDNKA
jgi:ribosomal protein L11 methyltransferase